MTKNKILQLIGFILVCQLVGIVSSVFTVAAIDNWYAGLTKPSFNPPSWLFAPVWTVLYLLMGLAVFFVWEINDQRKKKATNIFWLQLFLNGLWSFLFFGLNSPLAGLVGILFLWLAIVWTIKGFYPLSKKGAYLLLPYLAWTSFAAFLNFSLWRLNR